MVYTTHWASPIGDLLLAEKDGSLVGLWMARQKYFLGSLREEMEERDDSAIFNQTRQWLGRYFAGGKPSARELRLAPEGSEFRQEVWRILCEIPYGEVMTYGEIAQKMAANRGGAKMSAQAVGGAVGHNPISIIIPCHRVVGTNGSLTGYAGGLDRKIRLLTLEGVDMTDFFIPQTGTAL